MAVSASPACSAAAHDVVPNAYKKITRRTAFQQKCVQRSRFAADSSVLLTNDPVEATGEAVDAAISQHSLRTKWPPLLTSMPHGRYSKTLSTDAVFVFSGGKCCVLPSRTHGLAIVTIA